MDLAHFPEPVSWDHHYTIVRELWLYSIGIASQIFPSSPSPPPEVGRGGEDQVGNLHTTRLPLLRWSTYSQGMFKFRCFKRPFFFFLVRCCKALMIILSEVDHFIICIPIKKIQQRHRGQGFIWAAVLILLIERPWRGILKAVGKRINSTSQTFEVEISTRLLISLETWDKFLSGAPCIPPKAHDKVWMS